MSEKTRSVDRYEVADLIALHLLVLALGLYQLQHLFPLYKTYHLREILYAYLYFRVALRYPFPDHALFKLITFFLTLALLIAIHTWYVTNSVVAVAGFTRFIHVALLAPLVALIVFRESQVRSLIYTWMAVVLLGAITVFAQLLEFDLKWLLGDYLAMRGGLLRYKSLLGEPNVGGLAGVIFFILSIGYINNRIVKMACIGASVFLVVFSLSKSALILFFGSGFIFILVASWKWFAFRDLNFLRKVIISLLGASVWLIFINLFPLGGNYISVGVLALFGADEESPSALLDLTNRMQFEYSGLFETGGFIHLLFGQSFARAGSAAADLGIQDAFLPHNMYLELFMVGGIFLLGIFCAMLCVGGYVLGKRLLFQKTISGVLIIPLLIVVLYMLGYPNVYEPITGTILWLALGAACCRLPPESTAVCCRSGT
ncbi:MAG: hypothetical protein Q8M20_09605 [Rhodocyclaceae bacterium]|nr:hypothetical protein [Rhodocyclaceae bacterium]MDZ4214826.1 hypothetical protein [Rhodocyclaceae bacterium]